MPILGNLSFLPILNLKTYLYIILTLQCAHILFLISQPPLKMLEPANPALSQWITQITTGFPIFSGSSTAQGNLGAYLHLQGCFGNTYSVIFEGWEHTEAHMTIICPFLQVGHVIGYDNYSQTLLGWLLVACAIYSSLFVAQLVSLDCISFIDGSCWWD